MILKGARYTYCIKKKLIKSFFDKRDFTKQFFKEKSKV